MNARAIIERGRRQLHSRLGVPALYRTDPGSAWIPVSVRIHTRVLKVGDIPGLDVAQLTEIAPQMVFLNDELGGAYPPRGAQVSIAEGEAWQVGEAEPRDGITVTASVARIPAAQAAGFPVPAGA